jgi:hypothetical protein
MFPYTWPSLAKTCRSIILFIVLLHNVSFRVWFLLQNIWLFIKSTTFDFPNLITSTKFTGMEIVPEKPEQNLLQFNAFHGQQILPQPLQKDKKK